jgi:hypothetical protein
MEDIVITLIVVLILGRLTFDCFYWLLKKMEGIEGASGAVIETQEVQVLRRRFEGARKFKWVILIFFVAGVVQLISFIASWIGRR